ncbi:Permease of the major facilitator superfamily protein [alpha proteobacterium BAL199]|jgi:MFS transporter, PAT family, beta-lactamase induction signal transducer AmpG|nr:Permease of the major facilitator superfamily protein [alpha proteobacterium BAL199]
MAINASWTDGFRVYFQRRMLIILIFGFASGLPAPLVYSNLSIWLTDAGFTRSNVGLFGLATSAYALNFLWAPLIDRLRLPFLTNWLGRRRSWALVTQILLMIAIALMGMTDPNENVAQVALACVFVAFLSATQDIVIDAYRVDVLERDEYGAGSAVAIWGWHIGGTLVGGAGGLYLADTLGWNATYQILAGTLLVAAIATLAAPEPTRGSAADFDASQVPESGTVSIVIWLRNALIDPFTDFIRRDWWLLILVFVFVFKFGDALLGRMSGVFYRELGFSLTEIADITKVFGLAAICIGVLAGGALVKLIGTFRSLLAGGLAAAATNLIYAYLATAGQDLSVFAVAVIADNFTSGLATVAFVAYLSSLCNAAFSATQYALLNSLGNLARIWFASSAGIVVDQLGGDWALFFAITAGLALLGLPLLLILMIVMPERHESKQSSEST